MFAVASCQNYADGQYAAHRDLAEHGPDFVVWLGDYIYEDPGVVGEADSTARVHLGVEPTTLDDYRNRYARYKTDLHLQAAHAVCPWYVIWDDHEVENNYADLSPQAAADQPTFAARRSPISHRSSVRRRDAEHRSRMPGDVRAGTNDAG